MIHHRILAIPCLLFACAAPTDDDPTSVADTGGPDTSGGPETSGGSSGDPTGTPGACGDPNEPAPAYPPPGECYNNGGCASCNCLTYVDNPPAAEAVCAEPGAAGILRVTATAFEFPGMTVIPSVDVEIFNAFDVGVMGIENAVAVAMDTTDADGRIDVEIMPTDSIGMVAIIRADGFRATATGLAKPPYESSNAIHDLFVVSEALLGDYSTALGADPAVADYLPLGDAGGVVGIARSRYTGEPVAGVRIVSLTNGDATDAVVRYLQPDGTFSADVTGDSGVYVLLNPALAEEFEAELDGQIVSTRANKAGSGAPGVFTMNLSIDIDPGFDPFE